MVSLFKRHLPFCLVLFTGLLFRFYGFFDSWGTKDHYNFGGPVLSMFAHCHNLLPWDVTHGIPVSECAQGLAPVFYRNHPPMLVWFLAALFKLFGEHEWVARLSTLLFSVANVFLVYVIAQKIWPQEQTKNPSSKSPLNVFLSPSVLAAIFQSFFLGGIYFGTHVDFPSEMTVFFMLLSTWAALNDRFWLACLAALFAGLHDFVGFFMFAPLLVLTWNKKVKSPGTSFSPKATVFLWTLASGFIGLCVLLHLQGEQSLFQFVQNKILSPNYVKATTTEVSSSQGAAAHFIETYIIIVPKFLRDVLKSFSRLLSPLFFCWMLLGLLRFNKGRSKNSDLQKALLLTGLPMVIIALLAHQYVMVHIFWFMLALPFCALLVTYWFTESSQNLLNDQKKIRFFALLALVFYPYGIYQSYLAFDIFVSVGLVATCLCYALYSNKLSSRGLLLLAGYAALFNFAQTINYRTELPSTPSAAVTCAERQKDFEATGKKLTLTETLNPAERWYCRNIPRDNK